MIQESYTIAGDVSIQDHVREPEKSTPWQPALEPSVSTGDPFPALLIDRREVSTAIAPTGRPFPAFEEILCESRTTQPARAPSRSYSPLERPDEGDQNEPIPSSAPNLLDYRLHKRGTLAQRLSKTALIAQVQALGHPRDPVRELVEDLIEEGVLLPTGERPIMITMGCREEAAA